MNEDTAISEEMVLAGARALNEAWRSAMAITGQEGIWESLHQNDRAEYLRQSRVVLTAALSGQVVAAADDWRTDIENAPKDGSEVLLPLEFKARAFWCSDLKTWVLSYPFSVESIRSPTRFQIPKYPRAMILPPAPNRRSADG
jgi:hypothetical protein